ncbi:hypothetical protein BX666DRAFT_2018292 [Dichotomocladium elegans]|nr:hypothetical protein BX666DRAFT_2018292 [Dichotomocladium elegans]
MIDDNNRDDIQTIRKENVFSEEMTEADMDIIQKRVALQQRQFAEFEKREKRRKHTKIKDMYDYLTAEEMDEMLNDCSNDEEEVIVRMTQVGYLSGIRKTIATRYAPETGQYSMNAEQQVAYQLLVKKRSGTLKKTTNDTAKKQYYGMMSGPRLALDDAVKQVQENPEKAFEGWSQARIRAYQMIDENPNSYYYRFNAPGEVQRKGQWSDHEKKLFIQRLSQVGATGQWGIFAMEIPGRVGYQCSTFYRFLVETGEVHDPNYVLDEKGKAHYLFDKKTANGKVEKTFRTHSKHGTGRGSGIPTASAAVAEEPAGTRANTTKPVETKKPAGAGAPAPAGRRKRKRNMRSGWDSDEEDALEDYNDTSGTYTLSSRTTRRTRHCTRLAAQKQNEGVFSDSDLNVLDINPLPGFIDPITLDEVIKPAISKYGHVMGYDSWVRCLNNWEGKRNICPLTKKELTRRDLVVLTVENIDEYRDKIINL